MMSLIYLIILICVMYASCTAHFRVSQGTPLPPPTKHPSLTPHPSSCSTDRICHTHSVRSYNRYVYFNIINYSSSQISQL